MGTASQPKPVNLFVALLAADNDLFSRVEISLRVLLVPSTPQARLSPGLAATITKVKWAGV